jgi:hypothetical protein
VAGNSTLAKAGITVNNTTGGSPLSFQSTFGQQFSVIVGGDTQGLLGMGTAQLGSASSSVQYGTTTGTPYNDATAAGTANLQFSFNGNASNTAVANGNGTAIAVDLTAGDATAGTATGSTTGTNGDGTANTSLNDRLYITVDGGAQQTINLATGSHNGATESLSQVATDINGQLTGATATVNASGQLVITSNSKGAGSSVVIGGGWNNAATNLGLTNADGAMTTTGVSRSGASIASYLNSEFAASSTLQGAGLTATFSNNELTIASTNNTNFQLNAFSSTNTAATVTGSSAGSSAVATGTAQAGPFAITAANQNLEITVDGAAYQIKLTPGAAVTGSAIAGEITSQIAAQGGNATAAYNASNEFAITSGSSGVTSTIAIGNNFPATHRLLWD